MFRVNGELMVGVRLWLVDPCEISGFVVGCGIGGVSFGMAWVEAGGRSGRADHGGKIYINNT